MSSGDARDLGAADLQPYPDESLDTLLRGRIRLLQSRKGYRTAVDAMALAWFASRIAGELPQPVRRVIDLGAGSGLVAILMARHLRQASVQLIERQPDLAARAERNLRLNSVADRGQICRHDIGEPLPELAPADLLVCNPPYFQLVGRDPPRHPERHAAHCETTASLERFCTIAAELLLPAGAACFVYPDQGRQRLVAALQASGLTDVTAHRLFHRAGDERPVRVLTCAKRGETAEREGEPLHLHPAQARDDTYESSIETFLGTL